VPKNDSEGKATGGMLFVTGTVFILAFAFFVWGSEGGTHVASNPGPSGMPESTIINQAHLPLTAPQERQPERRASAFRLACGFKGRDAESIGLIATELVINFLKHAFDATTKVGEISVSYDVSLNLRQHVS
jgi:hypothetical protein